VRILFISTAHNSLSQRLLVECTRLGHTISLCIGGSPEAMHAAAEKTRPDLIVAPMLKTAIPECVWQRYRCLIVHPGIKGDRGPSSLDWALSLGAKTWGVTVLQADAEMDAGPIWASETFAMPTDGVSKSALYRGDVTEAAVRAVLRAVHNVGDGTIDPEALDYTRADVRGELRPAIRQRDRGIDWSRHSTADIARAIRAADSSPGLATELCGEDVLAFGAHEEDHVTGPAGEILGQRHGAVCVGTVDGAIWITHLKTRNVKTRNAASPLAGIKLPATRVLRHHMRGVPRLDISIGDSNQARSFRDIRYWEQGAVGYLSFDFYNGAMSTEQCRRLRLAYEHARAAKHTRILCLLGGSDFWSNGIHLNVIEAARDPARESWRNINAIDDLVLEILNTRAKLVVAGLRGNAGAGGVMLALAADHVYARSGVVLNPHYRSMGGLYGSEYWTYTLPRRVGAAKALELTHACEPLGAIEGRGIGLLDDAFGESVCDFEQQLYRRTQALAEDLRFARMLEDKLERRLIDERNKPFARYRSEELARMADNFFGPDPSYHEARHRFVHKSAPVHKIVRPDWGQVSNDRRRDAD
jgi:putative two-component system hydrogenase maturation factor HypX/HoxX